MKQKNETMVTFFLTNEGLRDSCHTEFCGWEQKRSAQQKEPSVESMGVMARHWLISLQLQELAGSVALNAFQFFLNCIELNLEQFLCLLS